MELSTSLTTTDRMGRTLEQTLQVCGELFDNAGSNQYPCARRDDRMIAYVSRRAIGHPLDSDELPCFSCIYSR